MQTVPLMGNNPSCFLIWFFKLSCLLLVHTIIIVVPRWVVCWIVVNNLNLSSLSCYKLSWYSKCAMEIWRLSLLMFHLTAPFQTFIHSFPSLILPSISCSLHYPFSSPLHHHVPCIAVTHHPFFLPVFSNLAVFFPSNPQPISIH